MTRLANVATMIAALVFLPGLLSCNRVEPRPDGATKAGDPAISIEALGPEAFPGPVVDPKGRLGRLGQTVEGLARGWRRDLGIDFQTVVVEGPPGRIVDVADQLFHLRKVGETAPTGGLLLVVDPEGGRARFALSYELEPVFPDSVLGQIAEHQLAPYASYAVLGMAVMDVYSLLKDFAFLRAAEGHIELAQEFRDRPGFEEARRYLAGGGGASTVLSEVPIDADLKARVPDERRGLYAPSEDPLESVEALQRVRRDLAGDPTLALFTPGSQVQLARYPFAVFEETRRAEILEASRPFRVLRDGDRAAVVSDRPAHGFVPVLLHRIDGTWRVDLVETWKNLFFDGRGDHYESNANNPYHFALGSYGPGPWLDIAPWEVGEADLTELLDTLSASANPLHRFMEAELLYRNCWVFVEALDRYEAAVALAPDAPAFAQVLGDRGRHLGFHDVTADAYAIVGDELRVARAQALRRLGRDEDARALLEQALADDPYDASAMRELADLLDDPSPLRSQALRRSLDALLEDDAKRSVSLQLDFDPPRPTLHLDEPIRAGEDTLHDHAHFRVTMTNRSGRPVQVDEVSVLVRGTADRIELGDHVDAFEFPGSSRMLDPGEAAHLEQTWGFPTDTEHVQLSYVFRYCWRGQPSDSRQCATTRADAFPR